MKQKKCKGTGKAVSYGCGKITIIHKFGLCKDCFKDWLFNSENGKEYLSKVTISAKCKTEKEQRKNKREEKESIKTKSYYEKKLQTEINTIVRLIDIDKGCISCEHGWNRQNTRQWHSGHRISIGSNPTLRYNLLNIFKQCSICNNFKSGNLIEYDKGLINHYGEEQLIKAKELTQKYKDLHLSKDDLKGYIERTKSIKKDILNGIDYTREEINKKIGIYV